MEEALRCIWRDYKQQSDSRTLLLIDGTEGEQTHKWFLNNSDFVVLDADILMKKRLVQKKTVAAILTEARFSLIYAIKNGKTLVVRMGESKTDFLGVFCDEVCPDLELQSRYPPYQIQSFLPRQFILQSGSAMVTTEYIDKLFHREDKDDVPLVAANKDKFHVIVTTTIPASKIEIQLFSGTFGLPGSIEEYNIQQFNL